jgi:L-serine dehydratase
MKRIKIKSFSDIKPIMQNMDITDLAEFFIMYESINQEIPVDTVWERMQEVLQQMRESIKSGLKGENITPSGMINNGAMLMNNFMNEKRSLLGPRFTGIIRNTLSVVENNACMRKIVAAPTAGAAGVIPGALITIADEHGFNDKEINMALFVAGGIGEVIMLEASLSGAVHGCQAEVGSASAMTAAAITYLFSKDISDIESAAAFALKSILGLICDPIAGLVETPCNKRNVMGSFNAIASAEMALAGMKTIIPLDQVIKAMAEIGNKMDSSLRETAMGGLANTPKGIEIAERMKM